MTYSIREEQEEIFAQIEIAGCWFCEREPGATCECGRAYCAEHSYEGRCLICALGLGLFESGSEVEPLSGLLMISLGAAAGDPYIVKPPGLQRVRALPISGVERVVGALVRMLRAEDSLVRHRATAVLAATTNSLPSMNPSRLLDHEHGTSLLCVDQ